MGRSDTRSVAELVRIPFWLEAVCATLFVLCVPLLLVSANVRYVTLNEDTYENGFQKYRASERTGLSPEQLSSIARAFIAYFQAPPGRLNPQVTLRGEVRPLFNEREVSHMEDVQMLMQLVFRLGAVAALGLLVVTAVLLFSQRGQALATLGRFLTWGAGLSLVLLLLVGALSLLDFSELFVRFHQLSFQNDLWMLDPRQDYLIMLFPEGFWFDVTIKIALLTAIEAVAIGGTGLLLSRH
jgi:integral membrane protein (TIGR01906 family)